nr:hypothetical protein [Tanacetum cinerariifolium]
MIGGFASNTPIVEKIDKIERQISEGKLRLLDNDGNPLVPMGIVESDSEVEVVFDETANLRIPTSGKNRSDKGYGTNSFYARVIIELRADVELKDNIVVAMPKITREGHYTCNVRVEYEWKPPKCSSCKVFVHIYEECLKNTGAGEKKTVKKPSQTFRGVSKGVEPTIEVSNSNPFNVLSSVDNDVEFGTNEENTNLIQSVTIGRDISSEALKYAPRH